MIILLETNDKYKSNQCPTSQKCRGNNLNYKKEAKPARKNRMNGLKTLISFSNQVYFENVRKISYSPQIDIFIDLLHAPIGAHLTLAFKAFVVENQIPNLIPTLYIYIITHVNQV